MPDPRIMLDEAQFRTLVSGGVVTSQSTKGQIVHIALSDIGWHRMDAAILDAQKAQIESAYSDPTCPERICDRCGTPYRGPSVYCSHSCAEADA